MKLQFFILTCCAIFLAFTSCSSDRKPNSTVENKTDSTIASNNNYDSVSDTVNSKNELPNNSDMSTSPMIGAWHNSPMLGSGYCDLFLFYGNGKFEFRSNQMDCTQRLEGYSGNWVFKNDRLSLIITTVSFAIGGHYEADETSCLCGQMLVGTTRVEAILQNPFQQHWPVPIKSIYNSELDMKQKSVNINGSVFYQIADNPDNIN